MKKVTSWIKNISPKVYFVMFLLVAYGIAREAWYQHWYHYAKIGGAR